MYIHVKACSKYEIGHTYIQFNGENVTMRCFEADDQAGYVQLYKLNDEGKKFLDGEEAASEKLFGDVSILVMPVGSQDPCSHQVTTKTVALYPPTQKETFACYLCKHWAVEVTELGEDRVFLHGEVIE